MGNFSVTLAIDSPNHSEKPRSLPLRSPLGVVPPEPGPHMNAVQLLTMHAWHRGKEATLLQATWMLKRHAAHDTGAFSIWGAQG